MECRDIKETLIQYSLDDLDVSEKTSIESHLDSCTECRSFISESKELWSLLETWEDLEPSSNFISNFWDKVEQTKPAPGFINWIRNIKPNWTLAGAMASIFLVSIITFGVFNPETRNSLFMSADERDELLIIELDDALSRETADVLSIYGPWDGSSEINGNGGVN